MPMVPVYSGYTAAIVLQTCTNHMNSVLTGRSIPLMECCILVFRKDEDTDALCLIPNALAMSGFLTSFFNWLVHCLSELLLVLPSTLLKPQTHVT